MANFQKETVKAFEDVKHTIIYISENANSPDFPHFQNPYKLSIFVSIHVRFICQLTIHTKKSTTLIFHSLDAIKHM